MGGATHYAPIIIPSVSSIKTNLSVLDYLKVLVYFKHPYFLISAYDIYCSDLSDQKKIFNLLKTARKQKQIIVIDSGGYESFWNDDKKWNRKKYLKVMEKVDCDFAFSFDYKTKLKLGKLREEAKKISGTVVPIIHSVNSKDLINRIKEFINLTNPFMIAIPERELGQGLIERAKNLRKINLFLKNSKSGCHIHLLGTGNPLSILIYFLSGADSFDGLEWCQTVFNNQNALTYHFQQKEIFLNKDPNDRKYGYVYSALIQNLVFYRYWSKQIIENSRKVIKRFLPKQLIQKLQIEEIN
jgi:queuine/archaeosine tRNA-ribosyltransferase